MIDGYCDPAFDGVREVFAASVAAGDDAGAAVAVCVDGRTVVDLWGGVADERTGRPWERETACVAFSVTKAVTATAALLLADRGALDLQAPVVDYWAEYGAHGKDATTIEQLLSHQAGLPAFDRPVTVDEAADGRALAAHLAGQAPAWKPGTAHGYHALTFGWLVGELVRRVDGRAVADVIRADISPDLRLGVPVAEQAELARLSAGRPLRTEDRPATLAEVARVVAANRDPNSPMQRSMANPPASFNKPVVVAAGWPAAGLVCTARALADFFRRLVDGSLLSSPLVRDVVGERVRGPDRTLITESAFGLGFMLPAANMWLPPAARSSAFGHPGASGALGMGDLERDVAFAYIPNVIRPALGDRRAYRLVEAVYAAL